MIISDTIHYRGDGTVSSVVRKELVTFTGPKGESFDKEVESTIQLSDISSVIDPAYASFDTYNKTLETQIAAERVAAETEKLTAVRQVSDAKDAVIAAKDAEIAARDTVIAAKDAEIAQVASLAVAAKQ